jgi:tetratricopeptide (TPR) repeat protein
MLETMRAFAMDELCAREEVVEADEQLLTWAVALATGIEVDACTPHEPTADVTLRRELANIRAAWQLARRLERLDEAIAIVTSLTDASAWRDLSEIWGWAQDLADDPGLSVHPRAASALGAAAQTAWLQGDTLRSERLTAEGLRIAADGEDRRQCLAALAILELFRGEARAAIEHALQAAACAPTPDESYGIAALAAAYAGDLEQAGDHCARLTDLAIYPSLQAFAAYVAGEVANVAGDTATAEEHYAQAVELGRSSGATFVQGIAAVGLVTVRARGGRVREALHGYRELIDYWERTGSWIQQWTTLRNLAALLRTLADPEPALFLEVAASHAPDAPPLEEVGPDEPPTPGDLSEAAVSRISEDASSSSRLHVLEVARRSIDHHLSAAAPPSSASR